MHDEPFPGNTSAASECPPTPPYQKVNRERGLKRRHLLTRLRFWGFHFDDLTPVSPKFTQRRIDTVIIIFPGISLTHSIGGSRGQDLIRRAFISIYTNRHLIQAGLNQSCLYYALS